MIDKSLVCQAAGGTGVDESFRLGDNNNHDMEEVRGLDWIQREAGWESYYLRSTAYGVQWERDGSNVSGEFTPHGIRIMIMESYCCC